MLYIQPAKHATHAASDGTCENVNHRGFPYQTMCQFSNQQQSTGQANLRHSCPARTYTQIGRLRDQLPSELCLYPRMPLRSCAYVFALESHSAAAPLQQHHLPLCHNCTDHEQSTFPDWLLVAQAPITGHQREIPACVLLMPLSLTCFTQAVSLAQSTHAVSLAPLCSVSLDLSYSPKSCMSSKW